MLTPVSGVQWVSIDYSTGKIRYLNMIRNSSLTIVFKEPATFSLNMITYILFVYPRCTMENIC